MEARRYGARMAEQGQLFEALYTGEAMKDLGAFLDRFAAEFRIATDPPG